MSSGAHEEGDCSAGANGQSFNLTHPELKEGEEFSHNALVGHAPRGREYRIGQRAYCSDGKEAFTRLVPVFRRMETVSQ